MEPSGGGSDLKRRHTHRGFQELMHSFTNTFTLPRKTLLVMVCLPKMSLIQARLHFMRRCVILTSLKLSARG